MVGVISGMAHEYYPKDKGILTKGLPKIIMNLFLVSVLLRSANTAT